MENNDRNRLIELLEEADIRETMTEGFDQFPIPAAEGRHGVIEVGRIHLEGLAALAEVADA